MQLELQLGLEVANPVSAAKHDDTLNSIQRALAEMPQVDMPLQHNFTPGIYARTIFMKAGTLVMSKIHRTEHPYVVTRGKVRVFTRDKGTVTIEAPFRGVTKAGTRRVLYILEDCEWTTFHATDETDPETIEQQIIEPCDLTKISMIEKDLISEGGAR